MLAIIVGSGIMAAISAYLMFKVKDSNLGSALQPLFFFMILASFIIMGSAGFEARNDCAYLLINETVNGSLTTNSYSYTCTERAAAAGSWTYRLPLWFGYLSAAYMVIYFLMMIYNIYKNNKGGFNRGFEK